MYAWRRSGDMIEITVKNAREKLSALLDRVEKGEEIVITRRNKKIARLIPNIKKKNIFPDLTEFRSQIRAKGKPMSEVVIDLRNEERY
jgi:prevent-host-death family protein